jgi:hypothetical protein
VRSFTFVIPLTEIVVLGRGGAMALGVTERMSEWESRNQTPECRNVQESEVRAGAETGCKRTVLDSSPETICEEWNMGVRLSRKAASLTIGTCSARPDGNVLPRKKAQAHTINRTSVAQQLSGPGVVGQLGGSNFISFPSMNPPS